MAATMKLWRCPRCGKGVRAPSRPRRDDVRRYCLPCSAKSGRLVARECPALDRKRAAKAEARSTRRQAARRRRADAAKRWPAVLATHFATFKRLPCWQREVEFATLVIRQGSRDVNSGHAKDANHEIVVTIGTPAEQVYADAAKAADAIALLLHELAHVATPFDPGHGARWRSRYVEAVREVVGAKVAITPSGGRSYHLDRAVRSVIRYAIEQGTLEVGAEE